MIYYLLIIAPLTGSVLISICEMLTCLFTWSLVYSYAVDSDQRWSAFLSTLNNAVLLFATTSIKHVRKSAACNYPNHIRKRIYKRIYKKVVAMTKSKEI